ncbi:MAG: hypothetical protein GY950_26130 [bacterium]|nr:hypothetical protein [bacterium]
MKVEFNPRMDDREFLELVSVAIRVPEVRKMLLAKLEQMVHYHGDKIAGLFPSLPSVQTLSPVAAGEGSPLTQADEAPVYPFKLVKKPGAWVQDLQDINYMLPPELTDYICTELSIVNELSNRRAVIATGLGFRIYNICAARGARVGRAVPFLRKNKKVISGTLEDLNGNHCSEAAAGVENGVDNNIIYINSGGFRGLPEQERVYRMIDYLNSDPRLRKTILDYFYIILKPLFEAKKGNTNVSTGA